MKLGRNPVVPVSKFFAIFRDFFAIFGIFLDFSGFFGISHDFSCFSPLLRDLSGCLVMFRFFFRDVS